jgi:hypothetical protein
MQSMASERHLPAQPGAAAETLQLEENDKRLDIFESRRLSGFSGSPAGWPLLRLHDPDYAIQD